MNTAKLLKVMPTFIMVVCLAYACYRIQSILPDVGPGRNELAKGLGVMVNDVIREGADEVKALTRKAIRDPFRIGLKHDDAAKPAAEVAALPGSDPLAGFVGTLSLDATFLQGRTQIAIINGRMYNRGQHLVVKDGDGTALSPLYVQNVQAQRVTLGSEHRSYELGYPDQLGSRSAERPGGRGSSVDGSIAEIDPEGELALYKRLLNSPLGKLGKSLTGSTGVGGATSRPGGPRGSRGSGGRTASGIP
jgi:hypothetical protein